MKLLEFETIALTNESSAVLQNKLLYKLKDLESFTLPISIENSSCINALWDTILSVNLMSYSVYTLQKLRLVEVKSIQ